jgi:hypothetical protein
MLESQERGRNLDGALLDNVRCARNTHKGFLKLLRVEERERESQDASACRALKHAIRARALTSDAAHLVVHGPVRPLIESGRMDGGPRRFSHRCYCRVP